MSRSCNTGAIVRLTFPGGCRYRKAMMIALTNTGLYYALQT